MTRTADVNKASPKALALERLRCMPRDLMEGVECLKRKAKMYLPRNPTERKVELPNYGPFDPWEQRVDMSRLHNMFRMAVEDSSGRAFAKPVVPSEDMPPDLVDFLYDVDGQGSNFQVFAKEVIEASLAEGDDFVLADHPKAPEDGTLNEEAWKRMGLAPYWRRYCASSVLEWRFTNRGRQSRLAYVRLRETHEEDGALQVRELYAGNPDAPIKAQERWTRFSVWRPVKADAPDGDWALYDQGFMKPQVDIPFVEFPSDLASPFCARPPYLDLAHLTVAHYRKTSDLDNPQHASGFPLWHWAGGGIDPDTKQPVGISGDRLMISPDGSAKLEVVETTGAAWKGLEETLARMETQGRTMANDPMVTEASANMTATDAVIRAAGPTSKHESWVIGWEDSISRLLRFTAIYMDLVKEEAEKGWGSISLNRQVLPVGKNPENLRLAMEMHQAGRLSDETLHEVGRRVEVIPEDVDFKEEEARLKRSGPTMLEKEMEAFDLAAREAAKGAEEPAAEEPEEVQ